MSKKTKWPTRVVYSLLALALAVGLIGAGFVGAAPAKESEWDDISTPSEDDSVILPDSDILDFAMGPDGEVIYAVTTLPVDADHPGACALFKSEDAGVTWDDITDEVIEEGLNAFFLVAVAPDDADYLVVAGANMVIGSNDGGADFSDTIFPTIAANIRCLDVSPERDDKYNIALGTDGGDIYRYESGGYWGGAWKNVTTGAKAYVGWLPGTVWVTSVAFSPCFDGDDAILAITATATATYQQSGLWGTTKKWNAAAGGAFPAAVKIVDAPPLIAFGQTGIALPDDFVAYDSGLRYNWVYVNYNVNNSADAPASFKNALNAIGEPQIGEVFRVKGSSVDYAGICCERYKSGRNYPLMASIAMTGEIEDGNLMVGLMGKAEGFNGAPTACCSGVQVYRTADWPIDLCCPQWSSAKKPPTGQSFALVAYTPDGSKAFASTAGDPAGASPDESAFSMSEVEEVGKYWNQLSLIDTNIDSLSDMAVNPACGIIWLFSVNGLGCGCDSVWSSTDEGASYMRVWCKHLAGVPEIGLIRTAPEEEEEVITVYLVDRGTKTVYWNDDSGLTNWTGHTAAPVADIMDLAVEAEDTIYAVDSAGEVSMSEKHGAPGSWSSAADAKLSGGGHTIVALNGYVLVGGDDGSASYSDDSADSFSRLGDKKELGVGGLVHVAFDSYFAKNDTVYAAVTGGDQGVWRWVIDDSTSWKDLKAYGPDDTQGTADDPVFYGVVLDRDNPKTDADNGGVIYAVYADGMARWLSPATSPKASKWDYLVNGVPAGTTFIAEPSALKICGDNSFLWAIDTSAYDLAEGENNVFVYEDCLAKVSVELSKVKNGALIPSDPCVCVNEEFVLEWEQLCNSSTYELTIALDKDFDFQVAGYDPATVVDDEHLLVGEADLDCNQTFYWRVRVIEADDNAEVIRSWWSDGWKFTVEAGPFGAIQLTAPDDGATGVALDGVVFTWTSVAEATSYDFALMDASGKEIESKTGLTGTSYLYGGKLSYNTAYTWQVIALKDGVLLSQSSTSTFRTLVEVVPAEVPEFPELVVEWPPTPPTPAWVWVVIGLGAVLVIVVVVLIFRTRKV